MSYIEQFKTEADILEQYAAPDDALAGATILLAWYGYGDYCGESLVIFEKDGQLFEVNGSHCSCMGLEGQWKPEETLWAALAMRNLDAGSYCTGSGEAQRILEALVKQHMAAAQ